VARAVLLVGCTDPVWIGLQINDPTESTFSARFRNDLGFDAKLAMCSRPNCTGATEFNDTVKAGAVIEENISSDGVVQPFRVEDTDGRTIGCLRVIARNAPRKLVIRLSLMTDCPGKEIVVA
jgi:hypothetical protein